MSVSMPALDFGGQSVDQARLTVRTCVVLVRDGISSFRCTNPAILPAGHTASTNRSPSTFNVSDLKRKPPSCFQDPLR
jgi:hypothetical protein